MSIIEKAVKKLGVEAERPDTVAPGKAVENAVAEGTKAAAIPGAAATLQRQSEVTLAPSRQSGYGRSSDDRETLQIPFDVLHEHGIVVPTVPRSQVAEAFRTIKRPLLRNISGASGAAIRHPNLVMVTSALQGEGKTTTSISLALSIAMEKDKTVLFVDADVARASACRMLGVPRQNRGLIDLLENSDAEARELILPTNINNFSILPAGTLHDRSNELLASDRMHQLMVELSERYTDRVIVFDSPPLLLTTEASVLASFMGQIVYVVQANKTPANLVNEGLAHIGEDKVVGMVLNQARSSSFSRYGYGGAYAYGYGYGRRNEAEEA